MIKKYHDCKYGIPVNANKTWFFLIAMPPFRSFKVVRLKPTQTFPRDQGGYIFHSKPPI